MSQHRTALSRLSAEISEMERHVRSLRSMLAGMLPGNLIGLSGRAVDALERVGAPGELRRLIITMNVATGVLREQYAHLAVTDALADLWPLSGRARADQRDYLHGCIAEYKERYGTHRRVAKLRRAA